MQEATRRLYLEILFSQMQEYLGNNDRVGYEDGHCVAKK